MRESVSLDFPEMPLARIQLGDIVKQLTPLEPVKVADGVILQRMKMAKAKVSKIRRRPLFWGLAP